MYTSFAALRMALLVSIALLPMTGCGQRNPGLRMRMVTHMDSAGMPHMPRPMDTTSTIYVSGTNHRIEREQQWYRGVTWHTAVVERCAEQRTYDVNLDTHEYIELPKPAEPKAEKTASGPANVVFDVTTVDTGETKQVFGHTAHDYVTTTKMTQAAELGGTSEDIVEDTWYLDLPDALLCTSSHRLHGVMGATIGTGYTTSTQVRPEFHYQGADPQGLALLKKQTTRRIEKYVTGEAHEVTTTFTTEITELKEEKVDPSLFEVPKGFKNVKTFTAPR